MNTGGRGLGVRHEDRVRRQEHRAQASRIAGRDQRIGVANGKSRLDPADIFYRSAIHEVFVCERDDQRRGEDEDVGGRSLAQFSGHRADRAERARYIEAGLFLEFRREAVDEALRRAAAQNLQRTHDESSMAAIRRSRVIGRSRRRTPSASNTAFAIAAVTGPCAASPAPTGSISGRDITSTSTSGTSEKSRIGYSVQELLVTRVLSKRTRSFNTQLVA